MFDIPKKWCPGYEEVGGPHQVPHLLQCLCTRPPPPPPSSRLLHHWCGHEISPFGGLLTIRPVNKILLTSDILTGDPHPTIQYKKGSLNLIADSLSRVRTGDPYKYDVPLHNAKPLVLKEKIEINMVTTCTKSAEQDQLTPKLLDLQIKVQDIFKTLDK